MALDEKRKMKLQALWQSNEPELSDDEIDSLSKSVIGAALTATETDVVLKLRYDDGSESTHRINPFAAKNVGMLLLKSLHLKGWASVQLIVDRQTQH